MTSWLPVCTCANWKLLMNNKQTISYLLINHEPKWSFRLLKSTLCILWGPPRSTAHHGLMSPPFVILQLFAPGLVLSLPSTARDDTAPSWVLLCHVVLCRARLLATARTWHVGLHGKSRWHLIDRINYFWKKALYYGWKLIKLFHFVCIQNNSAER